MEAYAKEFRLPKDGNSETEYEDASGNNRVRFAVADGATQGYLSGPWARQLVRAFIGGKLVMPITFEALLPLQAKWQKFARRNPLPWYAEEKANSGAFAAFVGMEFSQEDSCEGTQRTWRATAVGDSCLVQVREDSVVLAFPVSDSDSFGNSPDLLSSVSGANGKSEIVKQCTGSWGCEDAFFLMTDALACWFFKEREEGNKPWTLLRDLDTQDGVSFEKFVADLRASGRMKNDDVTLLRIDIIA